MSSKITMLKNTLGMGARANKYRVILNSVGPGLTGIKVDTLAISTTIPGRSFNDIEVWNQGRKTTVAGAADFSGNWSVTFMDTQDHSLRKEFIAWMEFIDSAVNHYKAAADHNSYMTIAEVHQLSTVDNSTQVKYIFNDVWPKSISDSSLSDSSTDMVEFTVEFNFTTWEVD